MKQEKYMIDEAIDRAINDGIKHMVSVNGYELLETKKGEAVDSFLLSLYSNFDIISNRAKQEHIELYIPVCFINGQEGFYCYYYDDFLSDNGEREMQRVWSEQIPYLYEDDDFVYRFTLSNQIYLYDKNNLFENPKGNDFYQMDYHDLKNMPEYEALRTKRAASFLLNDEQFLLVKKRAILDSLEKGISYYVTQHNRIAVSHGISYEFSFPHGSLLEWADYLNDVSMVAIFQGYPYQNGVYTYNRIAAAGAYVKKEEVYYIEDKSWYPIYHRAGCPILKDNHHVRAEAYSSVLECVELGCYACEECCYTGVYAPTLSFQ